MTWDGIDRRDPDALEALLQRAAKMGAKEALESIGLHDAEAGTDVRDLRSLIESWRGVKSAVGHTVAKTITYAVLAILALGAWSWFHKQP
jgi:hypothetical protein